MLLARKSVENLSRLIPEQDRVAAFRRDELQTAPNISWQLGKGPDDSRIFWQAVQKSFSPVPKFLQCAQTPSEYLLRGCFRADHVFVIGMRRTQKFQATVAPDQGENAKHFPSGEHYRRAQLHGRAARPPPGAIPRKALKDLAAQVSVPESIPFRSERLEPSEIFHDLAAVWNQSLPALTHAELLPGIGHRNKGNGARFDCLEKESRAQEEV